MAHSGCSEGGNIGPEASTCIQSGDLLPIRRPPCLIPPLLKQGPRADGISQGHDTARWQGENSQGKNVCHRWHIDQACSQKQGTIILPVWQGIIGRAWLAGGCGEGSERYYRPPWLPPDETRRAIRAMNCAGTPTLLQAGSSATWTHPHPL